jgi:hypothetical protein
VLLSEYAARAARIAELERELAELVLLVNLCTGCCTSNYDAVLERSEVLLDLPFGYTGGSDSGN